MKLFRPDTIKEAVELLSIHPKAEIVAGGQIVVNQIRQGLYFPEALLDTTSLLELQSVTESDTHIWIGAGVTHSRIASDPIIDRCLPALKQAAEQIGDVQIRNRATMGGSLAYADTIKGDYWGLLYALKAVIHIRSSNGSRLVPIDEWIKGLHQTALNKGELIEAVELPKCVNSEYRKIQLAYPETIGMTRVLGEFEVLVAVSGLMDRPFFMTDALDGMDDFSLQLKGHTFDYVCRPVSTQIEYAWHRIRIEYRRMVEGE